MGEIIPIQPWLPRSFIEAFEAWDTKDWKAWEFGSGFSTSWFARRVQTLWSMEHTKKWHIAITKACIDLKNTHLMLEDLGGAYENKISTFQDGFFDFVLVDGRNRVACFKNALPKTSRVIALDNGRRDRYQEVRDMMEGKKDWEVRVAPWEDTLMRGGKIVPKKDSWDALIWVRKGAKLGK